MADPSTPITPGYVYVETRRHLRHMPTWWLRHLDRRGLRRASDREHPLGPFGLAEWFAVREVLRERGKRLSHPKVKVP